MVRQSTRKRSAQSPSSPLQRIQRIGAELIGDPKIKIPSREQDAGDVDAASSRKGSEQEALQWCRPSAAGGGHFSN
jgi:hypothetical protein